MLPNFFKAYFTEFNKLTDGEYIADLTKALEKKGYLNKMDEKMKKAISKDDKVFALATSVYCEAITYNTELFEAAGLVENDGIITAQVKFYRV